MTSNFVFLNEKWPNLAGIGLSAENYLYSDPNSSMIKAGILAEGLARLVVDYEAIQINDEDTFATIVSKLKKADLLPPNISNFFYHVRKSRNLAAHEGLDSLQRAKISLKCSFNIATWFMEVYGDWNFVSPEYIEPELTEEEDLGKILKSQEEKIEELNAQIEELKKLQAKLECAVSMEPEVHNTYPAGMLIDETPLSVRAKNALHREGLFKVGEIHELTESALMDIPNIGAKTKDEILNFQIYITDDNDNEQNNKTRVENYNDETLLLKFFQVHDIPIEELYLGKRANNVLQRNSINTVSQLVDMTDEEIHLLKGTGEKTANEIIESIHSLTRPVLEKIDSGIITEENYSNRTPKESEKLVMDVFMKHSGKGLSPKDIMTNNSELIEITELMQTIGRLMAQNKIVFDQNGEYTLYCPSFEEVVELLDDREKDILRKRVYEVNKAGDIGMTLEEIGSIYGITRERIRQLEERARKHAKMILNTKYNVSYFSEDSYRNLFSKYFFTKEDWVNYFALPVETYNYLNTTYPKGDKDIDEALEDTELTSFEKRIIQRYISSSYIVEEGVLIPKRRSKIENYLIETKCKDVISFDDFEIIYKSFLDKHNLNEDPKLIWTDQNKRSRENKIENSNKTLWVQGKQFRYYDIQDNDYSDLYESISLDSFENTEISTKKLLKMYPEVMRQYDIRNEYELHNLLRKTGADQRYPKLQISRAPTLKFGKVDRDYNVLSLLINMAPVSQNDFAAAIEDEYGFTAATVKGGWLKPVREYLHNGVYRIDYKDMPESHMQKLVSQLQEPFYYIEDIKEIYRKIVKDPDITLINAYNLRKLGFVVNKVYAIKGFRSAREYFRHILTDPDEVDVTQNRKKFSGLVEFTATLDHIRDDYEIIEVSKNKFVNFRVYKKKGIMKRQFREFCDEIVDYVGDDYFTMHSLKEDGFQSSQKFEKIGDKFCESLLREDNRFKSQWTAGNTLFRKTDQPISRRTLIVDVIKENEIIQIDDLIDQISSVYGLEIDRWDVTLAIQNTDINYDLEDGVLCAD